MKEISEIIDGLEVVLPDNDMVTRLRTKLQKLDTGIQILDHAFRSGTQDERGVFHRYASSKDAVKAVDALLKDMKDQLGVLETEALDEFELRGEQSVKLDTGHTVYMSSLLWAGKENGIGDLQACEALRAAGLEDYVKESFNVTSLSSWVRELSKKEEPVPECLQGVIKITEKFSVGVRRS